MKNESVTYLKSAKYLGRMFTLHSRQAEQPIAKGGAVA